jgi:hypothetical protein
MIRSHRRYPFSRDPFSRDPFSRLGRPERRAWRAAEKRVRQAHEHEQLSTLVGLAAAGVLVTGLTTAGGDGQAGQTLGSPVEMIVSGRRLRAARVPRRAVARLRDALSGIAAVPLTAVGRYGPYWVLTFKLAGESLVVLAEQLTLLPEWGGPGGSDLVPSGPLATLGV